MLKIAFSPVYRYQLPKGHRFPMEKYDLLPQQLLHEGTIAEENLFEPGFLTEQEILQTHTSAYWSKLKQLNLSRKEERAIGFPVRKELIERGRYIAHGTVQCAYHAIDHGISMNIAGGTHHAYSDRGEGFCVFNDIAIAANHLLTQEMAKQVMIIDLDVHQGNGTARIFQDRPEVFTLSVHGEHNYPLRKEVSDLDIGIPDTTEDQSYLQVIRNQVIPKIDEVQPDFVFYLSGVDVLESDKLGRLSLSVDGCKKRDELILNALQDRQIPCAISMGGGYSEKIST
ncbi:MAG: histone deacetylase, partial [Bacteroidia bacterium]|nr:histone deacetylase [Bacteroidia bacterium]